MPELPEVETVRRGLEKRLPGLRITRAQVLKPMSIGYPKPRKFEGGLAGKQFAAIQRRGKYLICALDGGDRLCVHLGMSGRLTLMDKHPPVNSHVRVRIFLSDDRELRFEDMRIFGRMWYLPAKDTFEEIIPGLASLGREPLENLDVEYLKQSLAKRKQNIKAVLLDQTVIAGLGNIYADETLFLSGVHPERPAQSLKTDELARLIDNAREVLQNAIGLGGSTLRNYVDSDGVNGNYQHTAYVYARKGEPCRTCASKIEMVRLAGRSSHYCPQCQPFKKRRKNK